MNRKLEIFIVKTIKVRTKITNRIFAVTVITKFRFVHIKLFTADKTSFNFFFGHAKT